MTSADLAATRYNTDGLANLNYTFIAGAVDGYLVIDSNTGGVADSVIILKGVNTLAGFDFTDLV